MNRFTNILLTLAAICLVACGDPNKKDDAVGTIYFTESNANFANPERGFHSVVYFQSNSQNVRTAADVKAARESEYCQTLFRDCYYLTDYIESDIEQWYLDRLDQNMQVLRDNGAKCILQFAYKSDNEEEDKPWDATPRWVERHIDQLTPYLQKNSDVIFCMCAGFIGVWGEWYYTTGYTMNPKTDADYSLRWDMLDQLLTALPDDRQICLRTPEFKMRYLKQRGYSTDPLTEAEAFQPTPKARLAGHNDCFIASSNDYGTYRDQADRDYWIADSKYSLMGGETCHECSYSGGENAIAQMELYHWTHINKNYNRDVLNSWSTTNHMDEVKRRLGYRFVLDKAHITMNPRAGKAFEVDLSLRNVGFAALMNKRDVELVLINMDDMNSSANKQDVKKTVIPIKDVDPRYWMPGQIIEAKLKCTLPDDLQGDYLLFLNMPDPYTSLHNDPRFSIRLANEGTWNAQLGYNYLDAINIK